MNTGERIYCWAVGVLTVSVVPAVLFGKNLPIVYLDLAILPLYLLVPLFPKGVVLAFCRSTRRLAARFAVALLVSGVWFALLCVVPAVRGAAAVR